MYRTDNYSLDKLTAIFSVAALLLMTGISAHAAPPISQTIYIESDTLRIDEEKGLSHYQGRVKFKQGTLIINANSIKVLTKDGELDKVLINGSPTRLQQQSKGQQQTINATAQRVEFIASAEIIHLYGNALITQGSQRFSGEHIQYNSQTAQVTAQGNQAVTGPATEGNNGQERVKAVIMPKRESTPP